MTRDEIYDHLAQVYLGKRNKLEQKKKKESNAWLVINIVIAMFILASTFYGLSAFLVRRSEALQSRIIYALNNGPIRINYNLEEPFPQIKRFTLTVPDINLEKYKKIDFSIRGFDAAYPGIMKIIVRNQRNETSEYFARDIRTQWQEFSVNFDEFKEISDWSTLKEIEFVFEAWNVEKKKGAVLIDGLCFSG